MAKKIMRNLVAIILAGLVISLGIRSVWWLNVGNLPYEFVLAWFPFAVGVGVLTYHLLIGAQMITVFRVLHWFGSVIIGILLLHPLGLLFDHLKWPIFNNWAIVHGTFIVALPLVILSVFWIARSIARLMIRNNVN